MSPPVVLTLPADDPEALAEQMDRLATSGKGWINVMPETPSDIEIPRTPGALSFFKRGPAVPMATWTAPGTSGRADTPVEVGVQHGTARPVRDRLAGTAGEIPATWRVVQDHAKRGLVARPTVGTTHHDIARWLLGVLAELSILPRTTNVLVSVYEG